MKNIEKEREKLRETFRSGRTKDYNWRMNQLGQILKMLKENMPALVEALAKDLGRHPMEAAGLDLGIIEAQVKHMMKNLKSWMKPTMYDVEVLVAPALAETVQEPYGVCLIIGPFNYPIQLMLLPLASAIAAGNCVILKPSELCPACEALNVELINRYMDTSSVSIVTGDIPVVQKLLSCQWDKIFFTGSVRVGKIVMKAAAEFLTPVSLELGGKSPCYVDNSVTDMKLIAKRIMWGKTVNAGQTCIAPDYVLCHEDVYESFLAETKACLETFYGLDARTSPSYARIVSTGHAQRLQDILNEKNGRIVYGGGANPRERYVEPTIIADVTTESSIMQEEIFGPILPVIKVKNCEEAIDVMRLYEKPLALYLFGKNRETFDRIMGTITSGGVCVNDTLMHVVGNLPFGGVGPSGVGSYHGKFSFDDFSHMRAVMRRDDHLILDAPARYPPYTDFNMKVFLRAAQLPAIPGIRPATFKVAVFSSFVAVAAFAFYRLGVF